MKKRILNNFGLKLLSIFCALLLWLVVMNISDSSITVEIKDIPVQKLNGDALEELDKVYDVAKGDTVDIIVKGRRSIVEKLDVNDFIATADLSTMSITNTVQIFVEPKDGAVKDEVSITCVDNVMSLNLEEKVTLQYSVKVKTFGAVKKGYAVCGYQTSPNIITVEGPKSAVEKITEVVVSIDVSHLDETMDGEGYIVLYDAYGDEIKNDKITVSQDSVKVHLDIFPTKEVEVQVDINGIPKDGYMVSEVLYQPQIVTIAGEPEELEKIDKIVIDDVSISGMDTDLETTVNIKEYLSDGLYLAQPSEDIVITVDLEELVSKEFTVTAEDITLLQKTTDREYNMEVSEDFKIIISGLDSNVENVTLDKLNPKIYCKDMSIGNHSSVDVIINEIDGITYEVVGTISMSITSK